MLFQRIHILTFSPRPEPLIGGGKIRILKQELKQESSL